MAVDFLVPMLRYFVWAVTVVRVCCYCLYCRRHPTAGSMASSVFHSTAAHNLWPTIQHSACRSSYRHVQSSQCSVYHCCTDCTPHRPHNPGTVVDHFWLAWPMNVWLLHVSIRPIVPLTPHSVYHSKRRPNAFPMHPNQHCRMWADYHRPNIEYHRLQSSSSLWFVLVDFVERWPVVSFV